MSKLSLVVDVVSEAEFKAKLAALFGERELSPRRGWQSQGMQQQQTGMPQEFTKAAAFIDSDAAAPVYRRQRGFANVAITRTGAGDYTLTLNQAYDNVNGDLLLRLTVLNAGFASASAELASTTTIRTRTAALTAVPAVTATDLDYFIELAEFGPN